MKKKKLVLIGASTGGPGHLEKILKNLPSDYNRTIIIAQHMDAIFFPSMVKRFNEISPVELIQAEVSQPISPASIVFVHKRITDLQSDPIKGLYLRECCATSLYQPSVDSLFTSASKLLAEYDILACLLTGIGDDGAKGMLAIKNAGGHCISESQESAVVYGMPKAAKELNASAEVLSLEQIIAKITDF